MSFVCVICVREHAWCVGAGRFTPLRWRAFFPPVTHTHSPTRAHTHHPTPAACPAPHLCACVAPADELNLRLNAISQRLMLSLQLIPIQKAKATDKRLVRGCVLGEEGAAGCINMCVGVCVCMCTLHLWRPSVEYMHARTQAVSGTHTRVFV